METHVDPLRHTVIEAGYAFVDGARMHRALDESGGLSDWAIFAASWDDLAVDAYLADRGRYRRRRHAVFTAAVAGAIVRAPRQPHYQGREYNRLFGGVERWFEPIAPSIASGPTMTTILTWCRAFFDRLAPSPKAWHIEAHQFRIEARAAEQGQPTPEGVHRDGVDYVLVLLVSRENIASGTTTVCAIDGRPLGRFTLTNPFDAVLVDDARVCHGVTPVQALDPARAAHRDVLVVTFRANDAAV
jgi:hypothetical protein